MECKAIFNLQCLQGLFISELVDCDMRISLNFLLLRLSLEVLFFGCKDFIRL